MRAAHQHTFQVLTKRADRLLELDANIQWSSNIWMGVSVESDEYQVRMESLEKNKSAN